MKKISQTRILKFEKLREKASETMKGLLLELEKEEEKIDDYVADRSDKWLDEHEDAYQDWGNELQDVMLDVGDCIDNIDNLGFDAIEKPDE